MRANLFRVLLRLRPRVLVLATSLLWMLSMVGCAETSEIDADELGQDTQEVLQTCGKANPTCPPGYVCSGLPRGTCVPEHPIACGRALPCPEGYHCDNAIRGQCWPD